MSNRRIPTLYWTANGKRKTTMKFNTLVFDANLPTTQQVNVPTNTDYKVGMKVKRNGEVQQLGPEEFTITDTDGNTLSADADKTNGYVTFTQASNDDASFRQLSVVVEHGYAIKFYDHNEIVNTSGSTTTVMGLSADLSEYAGITMKPDDVVIYAKQANSTTPPTEDEMLSAATTYWYLPASFGPVAMKPFIVDKSGTAKVYTYVDDLTRAQVLETLGWPADKPAFFCMNADGTAIEMHETYTIASGDKLTVAPNVSLRKNRNLAALCKITVGTPFKSNFKLNVNEFKSQQGDIAETLADNPTVNVDGTYADGTEFSFDFCTK